MRFVRGMRTALSHFCGVRFWQALRNTDPWFGICPNRCEIHGPEKKSKYLSGHWIDQVTLNLAFSLSRSELRYFERIVEIFRRSSIKS